MAQLFMSEVTVVFADLTGSTGVFESLGNAKATQAITRLTQWIGNVCVAQNGHVVKNLGDGVLMVFVKNADAVTAVHEMLRVHAERISNWPDNLKMRLQVGMARGETIEQEGDYFGDAVNVASRLADLSGPDQILATDAVVDDLRDETLVRFRSLGPMNIRGRNQPCLVYRLEWQADLPSEFFTVQAGLTTSPFANSIPTLGAISMSWHDVDAAFTSEELPVHIGRDSEAQFIVTDPRVSRLHAKIFWREGSFHLADVSSYGTWVRFAEGEGVVALRRQECVLLVEGEIALGAPFEDSTVPTVRFRFPSKTLLQFL